MLRVLFLVLLLANLAFFAWWQGYFGSAQDGHEPQRLAQQLAADKLAVVGARPAASPSASKAPPAPSTASTPKEPARACRLVGALALADAERLGAQLAGGGEGLAVEVKPVAEAPSYWVHIPPLADRKTAEKKAGELKALGVGDFHVVLDEGPGQFAISLGLFRSEVAANEYLQGLNKRGVRSARIETREKSAQNAQLVVRGPAELLAKRMPEVLGSAAAGATDCP